MARPESAKSTELPLLKSELSLLESDAFAERVTAIVMATTDLAGLAKSKEPPKRRLSNMSAEILATPIQQKHSHEEGQKADLLHVPSNGPTLSREHSLQIDHMEQSLFHETMPF